MNRRAFLAAIFGSAVAPALPPIPKGSCSGLVTSGWATSTLQPGDRFTIAAVNRTNPISYRLMITSYEFKVYPDVFVLSWPRLGRK